MPKGIPLTEEEQTRRRSEIFRAAEHLFLDKGFNETAMREIAEAAGIGKSTLYDYFTTKDEILVSVFADALQRLTATAHEIADRPFGAETNLRAIIIAHLDYLAASEATYMKLSLDIQRLPPSSLGPITVLRHEYQDLIRDVIDAGIHQGCFRPIDSLLAARIIISALAQAVFTTRPASTPAQRKEDVLTLLFSGLKP